MTEHRRVTAGPFTLELPPNGVAVLYEADLGGNEHQLPGGVGYLEALVQFAGEKIRLGAMVEKLRKDRNEQDLTIRDAIRETASIADELAFWKYQAIWGRAMMLRGKPGPGQTPLMLEESRIWREAARQLEDARVQENRERVSHAEAPRDPGET